jgi:hypothetical protein
VFPSDAGRVWHAPWNDGLRRKRMSHRGVEIVLGRLATDEAMRRRYWQAPAQALREIVAASGLELTPVELAALESLAPGPLHRFALSLDPRLQKADLASSARGDELADGEQDA